MKITPLGHTEFLIDIESREGKNVRILVDSWLSDFVIGDLMERTVKVRLDREKLASLDAIYISHSHTDHLDPYTLLEIYKWANPVLFLSETLEYLDPILRQYLPNTEIRYLHNKTILNWKGLDITGIALEGESVTNEDDVMMFSIANDQELLFAEIDTLIPDTPEAAKYLYRHFTRKSYETVCYLASRNELEGNLRLLDLLPHERETWKREYLHNRREEIEWGYEKWTYGEYEDIPNIFEIPGFVRGFIGQGICYPVSLSLEIAGMNIFPLDEVVEREVAFAKTHGFEFPQKALTPGRIYEINNNGIINGRKECPIGVLERITLPNSITTSVVRKYSNGPLTGHISWTPEYVDTILDVLNYRLLPFFSASEMGNIREALYKNSDRAYRIAIVGADSTKVFEYSFASILFHEIDSGESLRTDETYYLADVIDFLEGRQELYSSFWHRLEGGKMYRLWVCLGANFCNHEIVYKKYHLHFERASHGETVKEYLDSLLHSVQ